MKNFRPVVTLFFLSAIMSFFLPAVPTHALQNTPAAIETITAEDGSVWERVNTPGFGNAANNSIVVLHPYQGSLYAVTRNDETGLEIWKTNDAGGWDQLSVSGLTDTNYYGYLKPGILAPQYDGKFNLYQNQWGDMIEYNGYLYLALATGYQGGQLYGSIGLQIWRFDGTTWEPIVAPSVDTDETGTLTSVADCGSNDGDPTAALVDSSKSWTADAFAGCLLWVEGEFDGTNATEDGVQGLRVFDIVSNTANTLTVQQNELAGLDEFTTCAETRLRIPADYGRPDSVVPAIGAGSTYWILSGTDEPGFGEMWNKSSPDFEVHNGELYVTVALNYQDGTRIWKTSDGTTWVPTSDYSFGNFHGFDLEGNPIADEDCPLPGLSSRNGSPVSSSTTNFGKFDNTLFTGGTGSSGCNGRGARVVRLDDGAWTTIVDYFVDENETGTNENGFGNLGMTDFMNANFQAWSWAEHDNKLFVSVIRLFEGNRIMYTQTGTASDDAWVYAMGGDSVTYPDGWGDTTNLGAELYEYNNTLYAGSLVNNSETFGPNPCNGADLWTATGPANALTWTRLTGDGFGDTSILSFEAFATFGGTLYMAASNFVPSVFPGDQEPEASGAVVYRLASQPCVTVTEDQTIAENFTRHTVTGITTPLPVDPDVPGFPGASYLTIGDIDGDGYKDIISTSGGGIDGNIYAPWGNPNGAVAIFTRAGTGLGSWDQSVIATTFAFPNETVLRDMDGDGDLDIMVMDNFILGWFLCGEGGIYWLENKAMDPGGDGDIMDSLNWEKHAIYVEPDDGQACPCSGGGTGTCSSAVTSYHRARFLDLDGDGDEDFITTKVHMWYWQWTDQQYVWMEWFKNDGNGSFSGPHVIGDGGGFLFETGDIDQDGDTDILAGQFFIYEAGFVRKPFGDIHGDSIAWFENPGQVALAADPALLWNRYTIDNEWTSPNPIGKCNEAIFTDIDNDGRDEVVITNHNHQQYSVYSGPALRYWPAGVYYLEIPETPQTTSQWGPITIEASDPNLDPNDHTAVLADVYGVDRDFDDYNGQGSPGMVRADDITGDGFPDLLVPGDGKGKLYYYESQGVDGSCLGFKRTTLYGDVACMPGEARFEDMDGDGDKDVVAAIYDTSVVKNQDPLPSSSIFIFEYDPPATLIELADLRARGLPGRVFLKWRTSSEIETAGFNMYRAESEDGEYVRINEELIPARGTATSGAGYHHFDRDVSTGQTYYYMLEDVDLSGVATSHGPVSAAPKGVGIFR